MVDAKVLLISECVINECIRKKYPLNTSKLMKLLYFMQKEHIRKYGIPMFNEEITYTESGPFISVVNNYFY